MSNRLSLIMPQVIMVLFGTILLYLIPGQVAEIPGQLVGPRFFPIMLGILIIALSILSILSNLMKKKVEASPVINQATQAKGRGLTQVILSFGLLILWTILNSMLGFVVTTFLLTIALMYIIGNRSIVKMVIVSIVFTVLLYLAANYLLQLTVPTGILF